MKDKLAIITPYRDREHHLNIFPAHMREFLRDKDIDYTIFIAEQADNRPFNYGKLCNVVVKELGEEYTYFAFHDIDMLPVNDECDYGFPDSPTHLATNVESHDFKLPYSQYFGGVVIISREDFEKANGYSNEYWGYGFEDVDLLYRLQRSGAYLETYYDLNKTYSFYDEDDILPYRLEDVDIKNQNVSHYINGAKLYGETFLKNNISPVFDYTNGFTFSIWFKTDEKNKYQNLISFEGMDSGLFLTENNQIIGQIWDKSQKHFELSIKQKLNNWNHVIFSFNNKDKSLKLIVNGKFEQELSLPSDFEMHSEYKFIYCGDKESNIDLANISIYDTDLNKDTEANLFFYGWDKNEIIKSKYGIEPISQYDFTKRYGTLKGKNYRNNLILDSGRGLMHLRVNGEIKTFSEKLNSTDVIYLPYRLDGEFKSLTHDNDTDIIENYYKYDPDVEENAGIFFDEVIPNKLKYSSIGLNTLKYSILDKKKYEDYELIRIVT